MPIAAVPSLAELLVPASLLDTTETGIIHFCPVYAPSDSARLVDFSFLRLNPTAQRLLELPEFPTGSFLTLKPGEKAAFQFYRDTYLSGETRRHDLRSLVGWRALAQRQDTQLVVSLTAASLPAAELPAQHAALRAATDGALARAQHATQQLTQEREMLRRVLAQTPAAICLLRGPEYRFEYVNPAFAQLFANRSLEGLAAAEVLPEALNQGFITLLDRVYDTGETFLEAEVQLGDQSVDSRFFNFTYQAHLENDYAAHLSVFAYDATEQVLARQQVQRLNEELQAANEELRTNNAELTQAQQQLQQLNLELEARVAAGIREAQQARADAERQQQRLSRFFHQAPVAICVLDGPELVYELINPIYQHYFMGRQLLGQPVEAVPELLAEHIPALLRQVYETGVTHEGHEVPLSLASPGTEQLQEFFFNCVYQARHNEHGQVDGVLVFAYDVTEQVLARRQAQQLTQDLEARVHERTQQLQAAQAHAELQRRQLHTIIEHAPVAMSYAEGPELRLVAINPAACQVWNSPADKLLGQPLLEAVPLLRAQGMKKLLRECLRTQQPYVAQEQELPVQRDDQPGTGYFNFVYQPVAAEAHGAPGLLTVAVDVTEQVLARRQAQQLTQDLETRVQKRTQQLQAALQEAEQQRGFLSEQQSLLRQILGELPAAVATLSGPEHRFIFFNDGYQLLVSQRAQLGQTVADLFPELVEQGFTALLDEVYTTGLPYWGERQRARIHPLADSQLELEPIYVNFLYQPLKDAQGQTHGILAFIMDVTEQVRAQQHTEALQAAVQAEAQRRVQERETLYQVFAHTPAIIALLREPDYQFEYLNQAFERLFPGRALLGRPMAVALPEIISQNFIEKLDRVYQTNESLITTESPLTIAQPDGQPAKVIYLDISFQAYQEAGRTVGVSVFAFDVSERVRARQHREASLHQLQTVFEQAPVALALLAGPSYVVEVASPTMCALWGQEQSQVLGRPLAEALPETASPAFLAELEEVRRTGIPFVAQEQPTQVRRHNRLETMYAHLVYQPLTNAQGQVTAVVIVATDVSSRVAGRQQLAQANEELRASNQQLLRTNVDLDNFIYTASHDLKAPIANIESLLLLLRQQLPAEARQAGLVPRVLSMMQGAIERLQLTIAQLTDLAQLQHAHGEPTAAANLGTVVEAVCLDLAAQMEAVNGQLQLDIAAGVAVPLAPQHLRSVVYNLLSNAFKYHHPDRRPEVLLRCYPQGRATILEVQDNGLGLNARQQAKLFELFRRLHAHVGGSGVGLYMVKRIVENAGGTVTVQSQLGVGTTFLVSFPA